VTSGQLSVARRSHQVYLKDNIRRGRHLSSAKRSGHGKIGWDLRCPPTCLQAHLKGILREFLQPLLHIKAAESRINNLAIRITEEGFVLDTRNRKLETSH
jgi:hypothetical protein